MLSEVFLHLRASKPSRADGTPYFWITVTHVCQLWREIALSDPRLWRTIWVTGDVECLSQMFLRSQSSLLSIYIVARRSLHAQARCLNLIMDNLPRIIGIYGIIPDQMKEQDRVQEGPNLRELVLTPRTLRLTDSVITQEYLGACSLPCLQILKLYGYSPGWESKLCRPTLKHLVLHSHSRRGGCTTMTALIQVLKGLPVLEMLDLRFALRDSSIRNLTESVVELPRLSDLRMVSHSARACTLLLNHISSKNNASLWIGCPGISIDDISALFSTINVAINPSGICSPKTGAKSIRTVAFHAGKTLRLRGWSEHISVRELGVITTEPKASLDVVLWRTWDNIEQYRPSSLFVFDAVNVNNVESLLLDGQDGIFCIPEGAWSAKIAKMLKLQELCVGPVAAQDLFEMMTVTCNPGVLNERVIPANHMSSTPGERGAVVEARREIRRARELKVLDLRVPFKTMKSGDITSNALALLIKERINAHALVGAAFHNLIVENCYFGNEELGELRIALPEFEITHST